VAVATGADFIREVTTGVYESDMGLWNTDAAGSLRERREFVSTLGRRSVGDVARSAVALSLADAVLVSGPPWVQEEIQIHVSLARWKTKGPAQQGLFSSGGRI
jgi:predicted TIM-barrel enzyme